MPCCFHRGQNETLFFVVLWGWFELFQIFSLNWHNVRKILSTKRIHKKVDFCSGTQKNRVLRSVSAKPFYTPTLWIK